MLLNWSSLHTEFHILRLFLIEMKTDLQNFVFWPKITLLLWMMHYKIFRKSILIIFVLSRLVLVTSAISPDCEECDTCGSYNLLKLLSPISPPIS